MTMPGHISFSQMSQFRSCPKSWFAKAVLREQQPTTEAASRGQQFDQAVSVRLGLKKVEECEHLWDQKTQSRRNLAERVDEAVDLYLMNGGWTRADEAQKEIRITPNQWDVFRSIYDVDWVLPATIVGYIDLCRTDESGLRRELVDLKTSERAEFRPDWALQCSLYALVERAYRWSVHLVTFTKQIKVVRYSYRPVHETFRNTMNLIGFTAEQMRRIASERVVEKIPASAGYHCSWCSRQMQCEQAVAGRLTAEGGQ